MEDEAPAAAAAAAAADPPRGDPVQPAEKGGSLQEQQQQSSSAAAAAAAGVVCGAAPAGPGGLSVVWDFANILMAFPGAVMEHRNVSGGGVLTSSDHPMHMSVVSSPLLPGLPAPVACTCCRSWPMQ
jgi:hypothetical protein